MLVLPIWVVPAFALALLLVLLYLFFTFRR